MGHPIADELADAASRAAGPLADKIAGAAADAVVQVVETLAERRRHNAARRAARILAMILLTDADRRRRGLRPRPQLLRRLRYRIAKSIALTEAADGSCLESAVAAAVDAATREATA